MLAGAAVAVGLWGVLLMLGIGAGLSALDPDDVRSFHGAAKGTGVWSFIAPIIAMFVGGSLSGRLAQTWDRRSLGTHGLIVWGLTAVAGLLTSLWLVSAATVGAIHGAGRMQHPTPAYDQRNANAALMNDAEAALAPINNQLRAENKPSVTPDQLMAAVLASATDKGIDRDELVEQLDSSTALTKAEAADLVKQLGDHTTSLANRARRPAPAEHDALVEAKDTGKSLLGISIAMLLGLAAAIGGALLSQRRDRRGDRGEGQTQTVVTSPPIVEAPVVKTYPPTTIIE